MCGAMSENDEKLVLPLAFLQIKENPWQEIDAEYGKEVEQYEKNGVPPCEKATSLKLLKRFARKEFHDFWTAPIAEYLPAVSEGTMKLQERVYPHDEAVAHAKALIASLSVKELAKDFLYGVAHNAPEYRTALACYYYIQNLPEHCFDPHFLGMTSDGDHYSSNMCEVCSYKMLSKERKLQFYWVNVYMDWFYRTASIPNSITLNEAILYLEEYKTLPRPACSVADYGHFQKIMAVIEAAPADTTCGKLRTILKQSGLLTMTVEQIEAFVDMLGYLNILHTDESFGVTVGHTRIRDMLDPISSRGYAAHPVNRWRRKNGVDQSSISMLFDGIYE